MTHGTLQANLVSVQRACIICGGWLEFSANLTMVCCCKQLYIAPEIWWSR